jgi:hypothetical protein
MLIQHQPPVHLTYCLNVHPGEAWADQLVAIRTHAAALRARIAADKRFGLGLRIGAQAAEELADPKAVRYARDYMSDHGLYAFTINGFPYGKFHGARVKEDVYKPDWRTRERRDYTIRLADVLAALLPPGVEGSISTVPVAFKPSIENQEDLHRSARMLMDTVLHLDRVHEKTGKLIHLGLEPEPCCYLETTDEFLRFFDETLLDYGRSYLQGRLTGGADAELLIRRHLGVCLDTCHAALQFENLEDVLSKYERAGIRISKVQVSAALECDTGDRGALKPFAEPVYLHQVKGRAQDGAVRSWTDLPDALMDLAKPSDVDTLRVHFHVPLFWKGDGQLRTTAGTITDKFLDRLLSGACGHIEIETYTFDVLPPELRARTIVDSIAKEYAWILGKLTTNKHEFTRMSDR